ncbi:MAG TPA: hypothetical protein VMB21_00815 [Candidatus Limnocylindria bacterium]|jgi:hypothetical protein|nr:hypothetical protein [Candidatus Limnocylindria bacterium]
MAKSPARTTRRGGGKSVPLRKGRIHPVVIYPYRQPDDYADLEELYDLVARLDGRPATYARPVTVMDRKTHYAMDDDTRFHRFREQTVATCSHLVDAWCVDTCQMWYSGLGLAHERGQPGDVYWLIPGDFNYGTTAGREVLSRLGDLPEIILELRQDVCIGEIETGPGDSKHLIDTYGTFALLYNWFPAEAQEIREYTERPRSEFFALSHEFLGQMLRRRWYAYEQTVVTLLQAVFDDRRISRFFVGQVSDLPEGRESLASAMQQVERTERVLKTLWRERNQAHPAWSQDYQRLESRSEQVRRTALTLLENLLAPPA